MLYLVIINNIPFHTLSHFSIILSQKHYFVHCSKRCMQRVTWGFHAGGILLRVVVCCSILLIQWCKHAWWTDPAKVHKHILDEYVTPSKYSVVTVNVWKWFVCWTPAVGRKQVNSLGTKIEMPILQCQQNPGKKKKLGNPDNIYPLFAL